MPTSTTAGRSVKNVLDSNKIRPAPVPGLAKNFCERNDAVLKELGADIVQLIQSDNWGQVYGRLTGFRTLVQIREEACKIYQSGAKTKRKCPSMKSLGQKWRTMDKNEQTRFGSWNNFLKESRKECES